MRSLSFGAVLWDLIAEKEWIGGAPFNAAAHLARLDVESLMLTRVGDDRLGRNALAEMERFGVSRRFAQVDPLHPTGWARVTLDGEGKASYSFPESPAYEFIGADDATVAALRADPPDTVCFGTLEQKGSVTRASLLRVLENVPFREVLYDVNIRLGFYPAEVLRDSLAHATVLKLNDEESPLVAARLYGAALSESDLAARLFQDYPVRVMCVTRGAEGCSVYTAAGVHHVPGVRVAVADTVGSGDAFCAAFLKHYFETGDAVESARHGNELGAWVASKNGAVPEEAPSIQD